MTTSQNPLLSESGLPPFDSVAAEHVIPAGKAVLDECRRLLKTLEMQNPETMTLAELSKACDTINRKIHRMWSPVNHLLGTMNEKNLRDAHESMQPEMVAFGLEFSQSKFIYQALISIKKRHWSSLSEGERRLVSIGIRDAQLSGIGLEGEEQKAFNTISQELSALSTKFSNHVLDSTKAYGLDLHHPSDVDGLSPTAKALAAEAYRAANPGKNASGEDGPWRITLDAPSYIAFMQHARAGHLREKIYRANISRASQNPHDNSTLLPKILGLRQQKARLLGFKSYADLSMARKMAGDTKKVHELAQDLLRVARPAADKEFAELKAFASQRGHRGELQHWDTAFWSERLREDKFQFSDEELKPYFPLDGVLAAMFRLAKKIFSIDVISCDGEAPVWHKDVRFFKVFDERKQHIASFYLDPFARPANKRGGAWMDDCLGREIIDGKLQVPVAHLVCNSTPPVGNTPSLMTFQEVTTLFHEFGHGLQHMLTKVDLAQVAGISGVEWDAVELPSQFMENWCYHKATLTDIAKHYKTGETIPEALFEKIYASKNFMAASQMLRQLRFGITDLRLHEQQNEMTVDQIFALAAEIAEHTSVIKPLPEDRMLCSFSHIFAGGYAAGYYSYKWAEVLSADAFGAFEEAGLDNPHALAETGKRFRDTVLARGGSQHPMEVFREFRGREPTTAALLRHHGLS